MTIKAGGHIFYSRSNFRIIPHPKPQTSTGQSPFSLMHSFEPYFPMDNEIISDSIPYDIQKSSKELNDIRKKNPYNTQ